MAGSNKTLATPPATMANRTTPAFCVFAANPAQMARQPTPINMVRLRPIRSFRRPPSGLIAPVAHSNDNAASTVDRGTPSEKAIGVRMAYGKRRAPLRISRAKVNVSKTGASRVFCRGCNPGIQSIFGTICGIIALQFGLLFLKGDLLWHNYQKFSYLGV